MDDAIGTNNPAHSPFVTFDGQRVDTATWKHLTGLFREYEQRDHSVLVRRAEWERYGTIANANAHLLVGNLYEYEDGTSASTDAAIAHIEQLFFNWASACLARVDFVRAAAKQEPEPFQIAYNEMTAATRDGDDAVLMRGLRDYMTHVSLTPLVAQHYPARGGEGTQVYVLSEKLAKCHGMQTSRGKDLLASLGPVIRVLDFAERYGAAMNRQDADLLMLFDQVHHDALAEAHRHWRNLKTAWDEAEVGAWIGDPYGASKFGPQN